MVILQRLNSGDTRGSFSRQAARRRTVKEAAMAPSEGTAINMGQVGRQGGRSFQPPKRARENAFQKFGFGRVPLPEVLHLA